MEQQLKQNRPAYAEEQHMVKMSNVVVLHVHLYNFTLRLYVQQCKQCQW